MARNKGSAARVSRCYGRLLCVYLMVVCVMATSPYENELSTVELRTQKEADLPSDEQLPSDRNLLIGCQTPWPMQVQNTPITLCKVCKQDSVFWPVPIFVRGPESFWICNIRPVLEHCNHKTSALGPKLSDYLCSRIEDVKKNMRFSNHLFSSYTAPEKTFTSSPDISSFNGTDSPRLWMQKDAPEMIPIPDTRYSSMVQYRQTFETETEGSNETVLEDNLIGVTSIKTFPEVTYAPDLTQQYLVIRYKEEVRSCAFPQGTAMGSPAAVTCYYSSRAKCAIGHFELKTADDPPGRFKQLWIKAHTPDKQKVLNMAKAGAIEEEQDEKMEGTAMMKGRRRELSTAAGAAPRRRASGPRVSRRLLGSGTRRRRTFNPAEIVSKSVAKAQAAATRAAKAAMQKKQEQIAKKEAAKAAAAAKAKAAAAAKAVAAAKAAVERAKVEKAKQQKAVKERAGKIKAAKAKAKTLEKTAKSDGNKESKRKSAKADRQAEQSQERADKDNTRAEAKRMKEEKKSLRLQEASTRAGKLAAVAENVSKDAQAEASSVMDIEGALEKPRTMKEVRKQREDVEAVFKKLNGIQQIVLGVWKVISKKNVMADDRIQDLAKNVQFQQQAEQLEKIEKMADKTSNTCLVNSLVHFLTRVKLMMSEEVMIGNADPSTIKVPPASPIKGEKCSRGDALFLLDIQFPGSYLIERQECHGQEPILVSSI